MLGGPRGRKLEGSGFTTLATFYVEAKIRGGMSAAVLWSKRAARRESASGAKAAALRTRGNSQAPAITAKEF
jgi:hypothetical protein